MGATAQRTWSWFEARPSRSLLVALLLVVLLRVPVMGTPLGHDEGGFLLVARQWADGGDQLYGGQWVDRPPGLILVSLLVERLGGGLVVTRLVALALAAVMVCAAWWAGRILAGPRGAAAAGLVAASLGSGFAIHGYGLAEEFIAATFVMASCALVLQARYRSRGAPALLLAYAAGLLAAAAFLTKQSQVEAGVFAFVLLTAHFRELWAQFVAGALGIATPLLATVVWAQTDGPGLGRLWQAVAEFRGAVLEVLGDSSGRDGLERFLVFVALLVATGGAALVWRALTGGWHSGPPWSPVWAVIGMLGYGAVSVALGGSWYPHYVLQLAPVLALGAALASRRHRETVHLTVAAALVATLVGVVLLLAGKAPDQREETVGRWLGDAARPGDSGFVAYGMPQTLYYADLETPYPYSWSLPMRVRDPQLHELAALLRTDAAPTWIVELGDFDWWGLDTPEFTDLRRERYRQVARVCGALVLLRSDVRRELPRTPDCPG